MAGLGRSTARGSAVRLPGLCLRDHPLAHAASAVAPYVTLSIGITAFTPGKDSRAEDLIARADEALYRAKETGRNRYVVI